MPLRDHFHAPLAKKRHWRGFHGGWPMQMVAALGPHLPARYFAEPGVQLGGGIEVDFGTQYDAAGTCATAMAVWSPAKPSLSVETAIPADEDEFEVRVYDAERDCRLVAAVEILSPANTDRPDNRQAFLAKCASLLRQQVSVALMDVVTTSRFNMYAELLKVMGLPDDPAVGASPICAAASHWSRKKTRGRFETWSHALHIGQPLPMLPL